MLDLTADDPADGRPWDFSRREKRKRVRRMLLEHRPCLVIGSLACSALLSYERLNDPGIRHKMVIQAKLHEAFLPSLYEKQVAAGRYSLRVHPKLASSWQIGNTRQRPGVAAIHACSSTGRAEFHGCDSRGTLASKPNMFWSDSPLSRSQ